MIVIYEAFLAPGADPDTLLSAETIHDTHAQVMTPDQASAVGFSSLPDPGDKFVRFIAIAERDGRRIEHALETSHIVTSFRAHKIE